MKYYLKTYSRRLLIYLPVLIYFAVWGATGSFLWGALAFVALAPIIYACIWKHDFGTWRFWQ